MNVSKSFNVLMVRNIVPFVIVALLVNLSYWFYEQVIEAKLVTKNHTDVTTQRLNSIINSYKNLLIGLSQDSDLIDVNISLVERSQYLKPYQKSFGLAIMGVSDERGYLSSTYDTTTGTIGQRDYFKQVIATQKMSMSNVLNASVSREKIYVICQPFFNDNGEFKGTIHASIPFKEIQQALESDRNEVLYSLLIDDNMNIISHSVDKSYIGINIFTHTDEYVAQRNITKQRINTEQEGSFYSYNWPLEVSYIVFKRLEGTPWIVFSKANIIGFMRKNAPFLIFNAILIIMLSGCMIWLLRRKIDGLSTPVDTFLQQSKEVLNLEEESLQKQFELVLQASRNGVYCPRSGVLNREYFLLTAEKLITTSTREYACLFVDLDNLKHVNDTFGHLAGDEVILKFTNTLKENFRHHQDLIGRFGGDEFVVYTNDFEECDDLKNKLERLLSSLKGELQQKEMIVHFSASIGLAFSADVGTRLEDLIHCADLAVYQSKKDGKARYTVYSASENNYV